MTPFQGSMHIHEADFLFCYDHSCGMTGFTMSKTLFLQVKRKKNLYGAEEMFINLSFR